MTTTDTMINGIMRYADREVVNQLPTIGKWVVGTGIGIAGKKATDLAHELEHNQMVKSLGIVDDEGRWDTDALRNEMIINAQKYGRATIEIPIIGKLTFSEDDIYMLFRYINGEI